MLEDLKKRLDSLGYTVLESDGWVISFLMDEIEQRLKSLCNQPEVPKELYFTWIDVVCGEFLSQKKKMGLLTNEEQDNVVASISEGNFGMTFIQDETPVQKFDAITQKLTVIQPSDIAAYRKLVW